MKKFIHLIIAVAFISDCTYVGQPSDTPLLGINWNLVELFNEKIEYSGSKVPHLYFEAERVSGSDGCNNFFGGYTMDGDSLKFGMLASTQMACPHVGTFEVIFSKMLSMTTRYRITGNRLDLYGDEKLLASFLATEQN
jgi:heat shock protein HslJ